MVSAPPLTIAATSASTADYSIKVGKYGVIHSNSFYAPGAFNPTLTSIPFFIFLRIFKTVASSTAVELTC